MAMTTQQLYDYYYENGLDKFDRTGEIAKSFGITTDGRSSNKSGWTAGDWGMGDDSAYLNTINTQRAATQPVRQTGNTGTSGRSYSNSFYTINPYQDLLDQMTKQAEANMQRYRAEQARAQALLNSQRQSALQSTDALYDQAQRDAYINLMREKANLPAAMAAQGITGGLSETAQIAPGIAYGTTLSDIAKARDEARRQISQAADQNALNLALEGANTALNQANLDRNFLYDLYLNAQQEAEKASRSKTSSQSSGTSTNPAYSHSILDSWWTNAQKGNLGDGNPTSVFLDIAGAGIASGAITADELDYWAKARGLN